MCFLHHFGVSCNLSLNVLLLLSSQESGQGEVLVLLSPVSVLQLLGMIY